MAAIDAVLLSCAAAKTQGSFMVRRGRFSSQRPSAVEATLGLCLHQYFLPFAAKRAARVWSSRVLLYSSFSTTAPPISRL